VTNQPRDWDREMAEIDKAIARTPGQAPVAPGTQAPLAPGSRVAALATWFRVILGLLLAVGMTQWPYANACGLNLAVYLCAILAVIVAGLWSAVSSWHRRLGLAHVLSLAVLLWGLLLAARELLPRTGYAREVRTWTCTTNVEPGGRGGIER
jgi:hypothetical protein